MTVPTFTIAAVPRFLVSCDVLDCQWRQEHRTQDSAARDGQRHLNEWHNRADTGSDTARERRRCDACAGLGIVVDVTVLRKIRARQHVGSLTEREVHGCPSCDATGVLLDPSLSDAPDAAESDTLVPADQDASDG